MDADGYNKDGYNSKVDSCMDENEHWAGLEVTKFHQPVLTWQLKHSPE